jgi:hypothetical protein
MVLEHLGQVLEFNIAQFAKPENISLVIKQINLYWSKQPDDIQDKIWDCYVRAHEALTETYNPDLLKRDLRLIVNELDNYHDYDKIMSLVYIDCKIKIPNDLKKDYGPDAPEGPLTYLHNEYYYLLGLMVVMRTLVPILGEYMSRIKDDVGALKKEMTALKLISMSKIVTLAPYNRLMNYVEGYVRAADPIPLTAIINDLGSDKIPDWLFSLILVRRVAMAELPDETSIEEPKSLIANIYNYIKQKLSNLPKNFNTGVVRDKMAANNSNDRPGEDSNTSTAENYKIKEDFAGAVIAANGIYLEGHVFIATPVQVAQRIDPSVPDSLVLTFIELNNNNYNFDITDAQLTFCQYILSKLIGARSGPSLSGVALLNGISICQALLWHWKLYDLAAICGANSLDIPIEESPTIPRYKLTKEQLDQFVLMYPHYQLTKGKKENRIHPSNLNADDRVKQNINHNPGIQAIEIWSDAINDFAWKINLSKELMENVTLINTEYGMQYGPNIRRDLADMFITLHKNKFTTEQ